ncbi:MAG: serine hydrolase [Pseudomonadota bacterium]
MFRSRENEIALRAHALLMAVLLLFGVASTRAASGADRTAIVDQRPEGLTGANWQFGPLNRWAYTHLGEILPSKMIRHDPERVVPLPGLEAASDDLSIRIYGERTSLATQVGPLFIDGVLVLHRGRAILERYDGTLTPERTHLLWSVSKTITGLIAASVAADGLIDLDHRVADYVPELAASGWGLDTLRNVLDMRDGSAWTEDYDAPDSTVRRQDCADGLLTGPDCAGIPVTGNYAFLPGVGRNAKRVGQFVYKSGSTDATAWVLEAATGKRFADLVAQRLWQPMGAERDAGISVDVSGFTLASGGMHATLRDVARVGQLMLNRGRVDEQQVIPTAWLDDVFSDTGTRQWPEQADEGTRPYYRSFVWGLGDGRGTVLAEGVHGQVIFVSPQTETVIVVLSSWPEPVGSLEGRLFTLLRAIEDAVVTSR